ncbi:MAG: PAS domain-containing protein, partial [Gaiellaceae bacterium]
MAEHGSGPVAGAPSAAQLTAAIERVSDGVLVLARDWTCTFINTAGGKLLGRAPEELIGGNIWQAFPEAVGSRFETSYQLALDTQKVVEFEEYFEPLNALFSIRTFPSPEGVTIYFTDVTELRRLAHERQATEEKLRQVAQQRRDLMDRLVVAQELERARIAADVHDDSVQALAAIDLRLGMLQRKVAESAPEFNELIRQLQTTLSGATDRLRQLLFDLEPTGVDDTLIDSLRDAAAHIFEDTAITWSFEGDLDAELHHTERGQAVRVAKEALT